jgi:hypothetical protein
MLRRRLRPTVEVPSADPVHPDEPVQDGEAIRDGELARVGDQSTQRVT